jgi:hypothetical protein
MMQLTVERVRALKGAPISVLMVLMLMRGESVSQGFMARHTGYSDKSVADALDLLADYGLARRIERYTWTLAAGAEQLPFIVPTADADLSASTPNDTFVGQAPADAVPGRNHSELKAAETVVESKQVGISGPRSESFRPDPPLVGLLDIKPRKTMDDSNQLDRSENFRANQAELEKFGVCGEPHLAELPFVNPRMIRYCFQGCDDVRVAIAKIKNNWHVPIDFEPEGALEEEDDLSGDTEESPPEPADPVVENMTELAACGIDEPARSRLAKLPFVSSRMIRYHCQKAPSAGAAIHRIEHNWSVPKDFESWR